MAKDFDTLEDSNRSSNPSIHQLSDPARRLFLRGGVGAAATGLLAPLAGCATTSGPTANCFSFAAGTHPCDFRPVASVQRIAP